MSKITVSDEAAQGKRNPKPALRLRYADVDRVRQFLHEVEALACEGARSNDSRIALGALAVLSRLGDTVPGFLEVA